MSFPGRDAVFISKENGTHNFKDVIAKRSDLVRIDSGRMAGPAANADGSTAYANYPAGTVLGYATSGAQAGLYKPYASGNSDGSQVAAGVLQSEVTINSLGQGGLVGIIRGGTLFKDLLVGYDATAKTALGAKEYVENGVNLVTIHG